MPSPAENSPEANLKLGRAPEPKLSYAQRPEPPPEQLADYEIRLNPFCCWKTVEAFIEEVVPHELAHCWYGNISGA